MVKISENIKNKILHRADWCCEIVKGDLPIQRCSSTYGLSIHHIKYRGRGGNNSLNNLVLCCQKCHDEIHFSKNPGEWTKKYRISRYGGYK